MPQPLMGSDASPGEHPTAHTSTGEWQSFEMRMRQRRIDRLLVRARVARHEGRDDEAREALAEIEELNGKPIALSPEIRLPPDAMPQEDPPPQIVFYEGAEDDLIAFDNEKQPEDEEGTGLAPTNDLLDLPLYPHLALQAKHRPRWGPRVAAVFAASAVVFWFASPRESPSPAAAMAESQPRAAAPPSAASAMSAPPRTLAQTPRAVVPAITEEVPIRLARTEAPADAARVGAAPTATSGPPVALPEKVPAEPRATSSELPARGGETVPASSPEPLPPAPLPVETPAATVPIASGPSLEAVGRTGAAPAPPPAEVVAAPAAPPTPAPAPSSAPGAVETAAPMPAAAAAGVRATLLRYESAYSRLDVNAVSAVWPALDRRALARAFEGLSSQEVSLGSCEVRIVGESAIADCTGSAIWTPKVGGRTQRQARRWQFRLRNVGAGWQIISATVR